MTIYNEFTAADWERIEHDWAAWWSGELPRPLVFIDFQKDEAGLNTFVSEHLTRFAPDSPLEQTLEFVQHQLEATHFFGDAYPKFWANFGPGVMAAFLGSRVEYNTETTWFHALDAAKLTDINPAYDANNVWWQRVQAITRAAVERWGEQVAIAHTDLGGNMDILASLRRSDRLLTDVIDQPEAVEQLTQKITQLWLRYYDELYAIVQPAAHGNCNWSPCWSPGRGYMLQSDFSYMISPRMFERFVLPDLTTCCDALDYAFYHMDGRGQLRHLDMLLSISRLRGIQWQPGAGQPLADQWLDVLHRIRRAGKLCQVYVTCEGALTITRELGGQGFLFQIIDEPHLTADDIDDFLTVLYRTKQTR